MIYRGAGNLLAIESGANDPVELTHNAWFPDKSVWWTSSGGSFSSIAAARGGLPPTTSMFGGSKTRHEGDLIIESEPFAARIALGADHLTEITASTVPSLGPSASAKYAGAKIPNITDGFAGVAPDMGAIVEGRPVPKWGAVRP